MRSSRWASSTIAICVARALRQVATCVTRPTSATAMNVAAKRRVMLGVARMGLHNMRATCTFQAVRPQTLGLIGLGAIGGSIARQVKQPGSGDGIVVVGWSPEPAARAEKIGLRERFAGSHPLAGTHRHGFEASRPDLFRGAVVYVTPCQDGEQAVREVVDFWQTVLEAEPVVVDADRHDAQLAATSHL